MNLNQKPTVQQLAEVLFGLDDTAGNHVLWVDDSGEVKVTLLSDEVNPIQFEKETPSLKMRNETFVAGNGYVGPQAAKDRAYVERLYNHLVDYWAQDRNSSGTIFMD